MHRWAVINEGETLVTHRIRKVARAIASLLNKLPDRHYVVQKITA